MILQFNKNASLTAQRILRTLIMATLLVTGFALSGSHAPAQAQRRPARRMTRAAQILEAETLLSAMGYWIAKVDGTADDSTRHAIIAFQKVERRKRTGVLTEAELKAMRAATRPEPKSKDGAHVELDLTRQVLFLVDDRGAISRILPISSGNEKKYFDQGKWQVAHTPRGTFKITRQINGVRKASLGSLYYPSYFVGGVAIHGSPSIPVTPASHGCARIPNFAAKDFLKMVSVGMTVMVYD